MVRQVETYKQVQGGRLPFPSGVYHVTDPGDECNAIVWGDIDYWQTCLMTWWRMLHQRYGVKSCSVHAIGEAWHDDEAAATCQFDGIPSADVS